MTPVSALSSRSRAGREFAYGLTFLLILALLVALTVALYRRSFADTVAVTIESDRAGLTLDSGTPVKLRGVEIGTVESIRKVGDGARIEVAIDRDQLANVPADVTAQIVPPTAFGAKYVQLTAPARADAARLTGGDVIRADKVTVEINQTFTHLTEVLDAARPAQVSAALSALATTLNGRGEAIGDLVTQLDRYLKAFNPALPTLARDLPRAQQVADVYADAVPDLLDAGDAAATTADTLSAQEASLQAFLVNLRSFSGTAEQTVRVNARDLRTALDQFSSTAALLNRYSPELPCVIKGVVFNNEKLEKVVGGLNPGVTTFTRIQPGMPAYSYAKDLPIMGDDRGPNCYGLPVLGADEQDPPNPHFVSGTDPYADGPQTPTGDLATTLFGALDGVLNFLPSGAGR